MAIQTLNSLTQQVRYRADMEDDGNFVSDIEIQHYINQALVDLYDLQLVSERGGVYCKNAPELVKSGRFKYDLPDDFYKLKAVHYYHNREYWPYKPIKFVDYPVWAAASANGHLDVTAGRYTIRKDQFEQTWELHVFPDNLNDCNLAVIYAPKGLQLGSSEGQAASWDDVSGNADYVIVSAAIKCLTKEQNDTSALQAELLRYTKEIKQQSSFIDSAYPDVKDMAPLGLERYPVGW